MLQQVFTKLVPAALLLAGLYWLKVQAERSPQPLSARSGPSQAEQNGTLQTWQARLGSSQPESARLLSPLPAEAISSELAALRLGQMILHPQQSATVVAVPTGDSLQVLVGETPIKLRLCGIDAPEPTQPQGQLAQSALQRLLTQNQQRVQFMAVRQQAEFVIAEVLVFEPSESYTQPILVNQALVQSGSAYVYQPYVQECPHRQVLVQAEANARQQKQGLWATLQVQPWIYRRQQVAQRLTKQPHPVKILNQIKPDYLRDGMQQTTVGIASWYGPMLDGRPTANGEIFDQRELTAAHVSLPFNTRLQVTNLVNGKSVIVRINDHHPAKNGSTIDLSQKAAQKIDAIEAGLVPVELEILEAR